MSEDVLPRRQIDIIVLSYSGSFPVSRFLQSLLQGPIGTEIVSLGCLITVVSDSADQEGLRNVLESASTELALAPPYRLVINEQRTGVAASINKALRSTLQYRHDVIILHPGSVFGPGMFTEIVAVGGLDPMIGFVRPRTNTNFLCSLPHDDNPMESSSLDAERVFRQLSPYLPRFQFVPGGDGPCLYIKQRVLEEFGLFDESYDQGSVEEQRQDVETDLIMRANRCGYRVAIANRVSCCRPSQQISKGNCSVLLSEQYPEYALSVQRYLSGARYEAERMLAGLIPSRNGRLDLLLDFSSVGPHHNGSFSLCKEILARTSREWPNFNVYVMVSNEARRFHGLDKFEGVQFVPLDVRRRFAVGLRLLQPFLLEHITRLSRLATVNVYAMLDPIMFDCFYLNRGNPDDLETLWEAVFTHADGVIYISDFVHELFCHRFRRRQGLRELVAYPSLDINDYRKQPARGTPEESYILVIGNQCDHKRVRFTVEALSRAFPDEKIASIGPRITNQQNVVQFESGPLSEKKIEEVFRGARFVVYPSLYEGFGLPILESLAHEKPVFARLGSVTCKIRETILNPDNMILFSSTGDLIDRLRQGFPKWQNRAECGRPAPGNWDLTTSQIGTFLAEVVDTVDFENVLLPRIAQMHLFGHRAEATGDVTPIFGAPRQQVQEIYASWSWRLTSPLRWLGSAYLRLIDHTRHLKRD